MTNLNAREKLYTLAARGKPFSVLLEPGQAVLPWDFLQMKPLWGDGVSSMGLCAAMQRALKHKEVGGLEKNDLREEKWKEFGLFTKTRLT